MMNKYKVTYKDVAKDDYTWTLIDADRVEVERDGSLVFYVDDSIYDFIHYKASRLFAPGVWKEVEERE